MSEDNPTPIALNEFPAKPADHPAWNTDPLRPVTGAIFVNAHGEKRRIVNAVLCSVHDITDFAEQMMKLGRQPKDKTMFRPHTAVIKDFSAETPPEDILLWICETEDAPVGAEPSFTDEQIRAALAAA